MTCSRSSSSKALGVALLLAIAACAGSREGHARVERGPLRVALLPVHNLSGGRAPAKSLMPAIATTLARGGLDVVEGRPVEEFLARHRLRYTGGVDGAAAQAAHDELGVDALVVSSLQLYGEAVPPKLAVTMRVVTASAEPVILWMDGAYLAGDDSPGLLGLGLVDKIAKLQRTGLAHLADSLSRASRQGFPAVRACRAEDRFEPSVAYGAPRLDPKRRYTVAVLPFGEHTNRRGAGELVALELARQLTTVQGLRVLEPGVVRDRLIRNRIVTEGGASLETTRLLRGSLDADLVLSGSVFAFQEGSAPTVEFDAILLDAERGEVIWESTSKSRGDEGVRFARFGAVSTASDLTCRMARNVADGIARDVRLRGRVVRDEGRSGPFDASSLRR